MKTLDLGNRICFGRGKPVRIFIEWLGIIVEIKLKSKY